MMTEKDEQLMKFYTKYNTMTAEEQQYMRVGYIELLSGSISIIIVIALVIGIIIGHYW